MRTKVTIDERVAKALKALAHKSAKPFEQVLDETLRAGLTAGVAARPYRVKPVSLGGVHAGVDPVGVLRLADALEDEEIARELSRRE